jgi:hypothetical protein
LTLFSLSWKPDAWAWPIARPPATASASAEMRMTLFDLHCCVVSGDEFLVLGSGGSTACAGACRNPSRRTTP